MSSAKKSSKKKSSRLMRILTLPIRALIKAKDNYVNSMNNLATPTTYGSFMGLPGAAGASRSSSVKSSSSSTYHTEDLAELIRSASVSATASLSRNSSTSSNNDTSSMSLTDIYMIKKQLQEMKQPDSTKNMGSRKVPRSFSVGMGKIDEDAPCDDFGEEKKGKKSSMKTKPNLYSSTGTEFMYPRSKSHAVGVGPRNLVF
jgi:hypothetical protein